MRVFFLKQNNYTNNSGNIRYFKLNAEYFAIGIANAG